MKDIIAEMYMPCLLKSGFYPDEANQLYSPEGRCFTVFPEKGRGHFWIYSYRNLFSISIQDFVFYEDLFFEYEQPRFLSINYYESVSGEELRPYKRLICDCITGHLGNNNLYEAIFHKNIPIRSIGIVMMPEYYEDYLKTKFPNEYKDPCSSITSIDGTIHFPELVFIMKQVRNFRGTGISAKLYYEGKVAEAISLIVEKTKHDNINPSHKRVSKQDLDSLASVVSYIHDHYSLDIHLEELSRIACMGITKLKYTFKRVYKCTITEYIQNTRMSRAEHLLSNTDMSINEIAKIVGYRNSSRFSKLFRKNMGLLPNEYRKRINS